MGSTLGSEMGENYNSSSFIHVTRYKLWQDEKTKPKWYTVVCNLFFIFFIPNYMFAFKYVFFVFLSCSLLVHSMTPLKNRNWDVTSRCFYIFFRICIKRQERYIHFGWIDTDNRRDITQLSAPSRKGIRGTSLTEVLAFSSRGNAH